MIRLGTKQDFKDIDKIGNMYPEDLGRVHFSSLQDGVDKNELLVYELDNKVVGFVLFHKRIKDQVTVVYDVAVHKDYLRREIAKELFDRLSKPIFLKCKESSEANLFYKKLGMILKEVQAKKEVRLNIWETL